MSKNFVKELEGAAKLTARCSVCGCFLSARADPDYCRRCELAAWDKTCDVVNGRLAVAMIDRYFRERNQDEKQ